MRRQREREGAVLVEGVRAVSEALDAGAAPSFAVVSPRLSGSRSGQGLLEELERRVEVVEVTDAEMEEIGATDQPQGVVMVCRQPTPELKALPSTGRLLVFDAIQDPGNVGTLIRSAVAFALDGVVCLDGTVDPWGAKVVRASAGAAFRIPIWSAGIGEALDALTAREASVLVASAEGRRPSEVMSGRDGLSALVLGNEGAGVRGEVRSIADGTVAIPMPGAVDSLNVGVAGSILMYEWVRCGT
jgi:TrmH family RNA methyltransferase